MKAGTAGGIENIVEAINTHIDNVGICENGCGALMNITTNSESLNMKNKLKKE